MTTRRDVLKAAPLFALPWVRRRDPDRPDVLVVVADDIGWPDLDAHVPQPDFDRLRAESLVLESMYGFPFGAPTVYSLLSGRYPDRDGMLARQPYWNPPTAGPVLGLVPDRVALPRLLRGAGYKTGLFGKWNLGAVPGENRARAPHLCGGEPLQEMEPGVPYYAGPGVVHWHGAAPDSYMVQLTVVGGEGPTDWLGPVSDEDYLGQ